MSLYVSIHHPSRFLIDGLKTNRDDSLWSPNRVGNMARLDTIGEKYSICGGKSWRLSPGDHEAFNKERRAVMVDGSNPGWAIDWHSNYINSITSRMPMHITEISGNTGGRYPYTTNSLMKYCVLLNS